MSRRLVVALLAAALAGCGAGPAAAPTGSPTPTVAATAGLEGLDAGGREIAALIVRMATVTFHARYASQAEGAVAFNQGQIFLELWSRPPAFRRDATIRRGDQEVRTVEIDDRDGPIGCYRRSPSKTWDCARGQAGKDLSGASLFDSMLTGLKGKTVVARDDTYKGRRARCFRVTAAAPSPGATASPPPVQDVCFTPDGIPLLIDSGDLAIALVSLERTTSGDAFEPPAAPKA